MQKKQWSVPPNLFSKSHGVAILMPSQAQALKWLRHDFLRSYEKLTSLIHSSLQYQAPLTTKPKGIPNKANACYRNSVLQALNIIPAFRMRLIAGKVPTRVETHPLENFDKKIEVYNSHTEVRNALGKLMSLLDDDRSSKSVIGSAEAYLKHTLFKIKSSGELLDGAGTQQDAADYLIFVLGEALQLKLHLVTTRRIPSGNFGHSIDPVPLLRLAPSARDMQELISDLFVAQRGNDKWNFEGIAHADYTMTLRIDQEPPSFIPLHINRLQFDLKTQKKIRDASVLSIPEDRIIDLSLGFGQSRGSVLYKIVSFIVHLGSAIGGHYVTFAERHPEGWYRLDDATVTAVSNEEGLSALRANGYILILERVVAPRV